MKNFKLKNFFEDVLTDDEWRSTKEIRCRQQRSAGEKSN